MKKDNSRTYTAIATAAAFAQIYLPQLHLSDIAAQIISAGLLSIVSVFTILKQRVSVEVNSRSTILTWILVGSAALGGINEIIGFINFNEAWQTGLRSAIAGLIGLLNIVSKSWFPTEAAEAIQNVKDSIKQGEIQVLEALK